MPTREFGPGARAKESSAAACADRCAALGGGGGAPACQSFMFNAEGRECWMYAARALPAPDPGFDCGRAAAASLYRGGPEPLLEERGVADSRRGLPKSREHESRRCAGVTRGGR